MENPKRDLPNVRSCAQKWVRMTDANCKSAVAWYKTCALLASTMKDAERQEYTTSLIENIKLSSDDYFRDSRRPLSTLNIIERELGRVVETLMSPLRMSKDIDLALDPRGKFSSTISSYSPWTIDRNFLLKATWIVGIATVIMTIVIMVIMCMYYFQYRKIRGAGNMNDSEDSYMDFNSPKPQQCQCSRRVWDTGENKKSQNNKYKVSFTDFSDEGDDSANNIGIRFTTVDSTRAAEDQKSPNPQTKKKPREKRRNK